MTKNAHKTIIKKSLDHRSISLNVTLSCIFTNNKKRPVINFKNPEEWERYKRIFAELAQEIRDAVDNIQDINKLRVKIHIINMEIQLESFGITWEGPSKQKKMAKRDSKENKELHLKQQEELNELALKTLTTKHTGSKT